MTFRIHIPLSLYTYKHTHFEDLVFLKSFGSWGITGEIAYVEHLTPQRWQLNEVLLCSITSIRTLQLRCKAENSGSHWVWQEAKKAAELKSDTLNWSKCGPGCHSDTGYSRNQTHTLVTTICSKNKPDLLAFVLFLTLLVLHNTQWFQPTPGIW